LADRAVFEIAYEGPALEDGIMDVNELAPALLALGNLVDSANKAIGDPDSQTRVVVRSNFEKGSFQITLELIYRLSEQLKLIFDVKQVATSADKLLGWVGLVSCSGVSLIELLKLIRGRTINSAIIIDNGQVRLELNGDNGQYEYIVADENAIRLYRDIPTRENLRKILSPLEKEGITGFSTRKGTEVIERITKEEVSHFDVREAPEAEQTTTSRREALVNLVEVPFADDLKWRFSDGDNRFYAIMDDKEFQERINEGHPFSKGDTLQVMLETKQVAAHGSIKNEHRVIKVLRYNSRPQQLSFPFDNAGHDES
jgi:hypothetical protein